MKILKVLTLALLFLSAIFFAYSFFMAETDPTYEFVYQCSKYIFIFLLILYFVVYFISISTEPAIKKKEIVKGFDDDTTKDKSFPSVFK
jgi:hypothetical protein